MSIDHPNSPISPATYRSYQNLPALAGLCSFQQAAQPGLSIDEAVERLKRLHYVLRRLHEALLARITPEPIMEMKTIFSHHGYLASEHVLMLRDRVGEMREPPLGLDRIPHDALALLLDEVRAASTLEAFLLGVYEVTLPALQSAVQQHMHDTNPLADAPSVRVCRFIDLELTDMIRVGQQAITCLLTPQHRQAMQPWLTLLQQCLSNAGGILGNQPITQHQLKRQHSQAIWQFDPTPKRDERFKDLWNQGVNAELYIHDPQIDPQSKSLMLLFKRIREIDVPEMMASFIVQTTGKPWNYYRDMTRQLWDEARHAMLGELGFVVLGVDWTDCRITHNWSCRLNNECSPLERHAVLWYIEQGLMGKTGKRYEWELGRESGIPIMATIQDFDWADEVLHAQIGREWYVKAMGDRDKALEFGDKAWSRILSNWQAVKDQGLTEHANWWPSVYAKACTAWGIEPNPKALSFNINYNNARPDLQDVAHALHSG